MRTRPELANAVTALKIAIAAHLEHDERGEAELKGAMLYTLEWVAGESREWLDEATDAIRNCRARMAAAN